MSAHQRRKGVRGEQDLVRALREGGIEAQRVSPMEAGGAMFGDVRDGMGHVWQVKRRASSPLYEWLDGVDRLAIRADGEDWLVVLRLDDYLGLAAPEQGGASA